MGKRILFPFLLNTDFHHGYSWAMELAVRMDARLSFFTVVPDGHPADTGTVRKINHSLLAARGKYLQYFRLSRKNVAEIKTERCIEQGDFTGSLLKFIQEKPFDVVVVDPLASTLSGDSLLDVVRHSNGVIVLPDQKSALETPAVSGPEIEMKMTENFYDILRKSDTYKLPRNFFSTLGRDQGLYNYLRGLFRRS